MKLPPGFRLDLVAAEPLIREPSAMCFDERGRLFVCEIHGYNLDGYLDIVELNKTGKLDREVRRVRHATPESQEAAKRETYGRVTLLRDIDDDGQMDTAEVWADRLPPCYGVIAARGGVIVVCAPDIVFLADRDGDGRAEVRETMFTGFSRELIERGISNPRWGPDNWIYVAAGGGGGMISGPRLSQSVTIGQTDFRFRPDGSEIEPVTGREFMFGLAFTDFGDRFHTIISYSSPLPYHYLARNPYLESPAGDVAVNPSRTIFPISKPDPWRKARGSDPAWVKFYGEAETQPNGQFTASSGQVIYRADALPEPYRGNYFVCDPANNLIHRSLLERRGTEYLARRAPENENSEFLASTDSWFRPINLGVGPDGAIYIVDMYREIIEDFSAIPRFLQQQYAASLIAGRDYGRIWRLSWQGDQAVDRGIVPVQLDIMTADDLIKHLDHPNHWWRETAQRLLVERGDLATRGALATLVHRGNTPQGRTCALYVLDGLSLLVPQDVLHALGDEDAGVRLHALQLADRMLDEHAAVLDRVLAMTDDDDPRIRLQVALTLGESRQQRAVAALAALAANHGHERWMSSAVASSIAQTADAFLGNMLAGPTSDGVLAMLDKVAETVGARRDESAVGSLLQQTAGLTGPEAANRQRILLDGLIRGLGHGKPCPLRTEPIVRGLEGLLASSSSDVSRQAVHIAGLLQLSDSPLMQAAWKTAEKTALDSERSLQSRLDAVSLLAVAPWSRQRPLRELLDARQTTELQLAVVKALGNSDEGDVADVLLENWAGLVPKVQDSVVDAFFARQDRLPRLLAAVEKGLVPGATMSALRREQLIEHGNTAIRERARQLLVGRIHDDRVPVLQLYASALTLSRDPRRGQAVFVKTCAKCHKLADQGFEVGPNLLAARTRADETLLVDILDPSSTLTHGYTVYAIVTTDGRNHSGLLASETATSVTLRNAGEATGLADDTILRKDIDEMRALTKSLMPEGLEKELTPQNVADLIGFLRHSLGPVVAPGMVLFDDEPTFLAALTEGAAKASLTTSDKHGGDAALLLTEGQRFSPRILDWQFHIVEYPDTNDRAATNRNESNTSPLPSPTFRYLRFAWKSVGAQGVMFELAADGHWPPADKPLRRYYSGRNSSGWAATEVSPDVPTEWTVVTVDLWKDFGEFTLTGIAPTALEGPALFDKIELLRSLEDRPGDRVLPQSEAE
ncbi:MAG TPA: PVC-type heme-binding CxxCH protein [Pirellulales bacterium]|nr:PVC-type heme-binding CxxCH protein [Pirellulales bacterium]